jgi:S1-C subfamily serine protease
VALTTVDWIALGVVILSALAGMRRGLVLSVFSFVGVIVGAYLGSRIAPHLLRDGASSPWTPLAGLVGAGLGAFFFQTLAGFAGSFIRGGLRLTPLRLLDSFGGLVVGAAIGLAIVWVCSAVALLAPGQTKLRRDVQSSEFVSRLSDAVPPRNLLHLLARIDPFPAITGPAVPDQPPSSTVIADPTIRAAATRVVRILGTSCGVGVEGSGWFARPDLVITAAHVVAGERDTIVQIQGEGTSRPATVVAFDVHNDVAVLRIPGADVTPLPVVDPKPGTPVAIVGYPQDGPLTASPGRIGRTAVAFTQDALGHGPVARTITALAGSIRHGDSGGPAIDGSGAVQTTVFAARIGESGGYGVPASVVRDALDGAKAPVSTGGCG